MCFLKVSSIRNSIHRQSAFKKCEQTKPESLEGNENVEKNIIVELQKSKEICQVNLTTIHELNYNFINQFPVLIELINYNNGLTMVLLEKNTILQNNILILQQVIIQKRNQEKNTKNLQNLTSIVLDQGSPKDNLIAKLFPNTKSYKYKLLLQNPLDLILYKQRNFQININLVDSNQNIIINSNPVPVSFSIYTFEQQPQLLDMNKNNQPILKGNGQSQIYHGKASFKKISIKEVSSYYCKGRWNLVIYAKMGSFSYNNRVSNMEQVIQQSEIKPLVLEIIVKAKKM